jgi:hypothetical protein
MKSNVIHFRKYKGKQKVPVLGKWEYWKITPLFLIYQNCFI